MGIEEAGSKIALWREHPDIFVRDVFNVVPDAWQDEALKVFPHNQRLSLLAPLAMDNIIPTPDGMRRWGDIQVGDKVFAADGTPTEVIERHDAGVRPIYRVTFNDDTYVDASDNHLWTIVDLKHKQYDISTIDLFKYSIKTGRQFKYNIPSQGASLFRKSKLPLDPYVFGLWIGDGSRDEPAIICPDPAIRAEIENSGYKTSLKANKKTVRVLDKVKEFKETGINDLYCYEKYIPDMYKYSSVEQRISLLQGMMDSDGTVTLNNQMYYATSSAKLADDIMWLARSLGFWAKRSGPYKINNGENRDSYRVTISGSICPFRAKTSKLARWQTFKHKTKKKSISAVTYIADKDCMCITIKHESHLFLANNFSPTHNCKGPGKAQPKSLWIHTPNGLTAFGSLVPGSLVFAPDGSSTKVVNIFDRGVLPMYRITFDDGSNTLCCGEHLWRVASASDPTSFFDADTNYIISHPDRYVLPRTLPTHFKIRQAPLSMSPYKLGVISNLPELIRGVGELRDVPVTERFIPRSYKYLSPQDRFSLLSGLIDANSSPYSSLLEFRSPELARDTAWIFRSLGIWASVYKKRFVFYSPGRRRSIVSIVPDKPAEAMCIEVEHTSHCYLTNDFIVTHNTATLAWLGWNFLLTRSNPKIGALSITEKNLKDGLWSEMTKWQAKSPLLTQCFDSNSERIFIKDDAYKANWYMSARSWSKGADDKTLGQTLQGFHADNVMILMDESGGIPDAIMSAAEAILASCVDGHIVQAGNPMELSGPLYRSATRDRDKWYVIEITADPDDPKRTPRVPIEWAREQIAMYGRDNPWVLSSVFGKFPPSSINSLIGINDLNEAAKRVYDFNQYGMSAHILGVDVAREGADSSIITKRQGLVIFPQMQYRNLTGTEGADIVSRVCREWQVDNMFIDGTGGYGASWIDNLVRLGYSPFDIKFNAKASNPMRFANKRTEMMFDFVEWIKRGGQIPDCPELIAALSTTTYSFQGDKLILEPKDSIKSRLGYSPDHMDSAMLTFAGQVETTHNFFPDIPQNITQSYNPLSTDYFNNQINQYNPFRTN